MQKRKNNDTYNMLVVLVLIVKTEKNYKSFYLSTMTVPESLHVVPYVDNHFLIGFCLQISQQRKQH